jgi:hypothetical protein
MVMSTQDLLSNFNPNEHLMQIKSKEGNKDYLPVQWRIAWFRAACPQGTIETEMLQLDWDAEFSEDKWVWDNSRRSNVLTTATGKGVALFRAIVKDGMGGVATGTKSEKGVSFPDFIEKAETGAIGRALAALGYGTQFAGDEWDEAHRIADAPVDKSQATKETKQPQAMGEYPASEQQRSSITKLCESLGKQSPLTDKTTFEQAKGMIQQLTTEYKDLRARQQQPASTPVNEEKSTTKQPPSVSDVRARVAKVKPENSQGLMKFEQYFRSTCQKKYISDDAISPEDCIKMWQALDSLEHTRAENARKAQLAGQLPVAS